MIIIKPQNSSFIVTLLFGILLIINMKFFGFVSVENMSGIANSVNRTGEVVIVFLILFCCLTKTTKIKLDYWSKYFVFVILSIFICGSYGIIAYNQSIFDIYVMQNCMFLLILIPIFTQNNQIFYTVIRIMMIFAVINIIVTCIQSFLYNTSGIVFLSNIERTIMRNGLLRYGNATSYAPLIVIFIIGNYKKGTNFLPPVLKIIFLLLSLYSIIFVNQTRGIIIAVLGSLFVMLLFKNKGNKKRIFTLIGLLIAVIIVVNTSQFQYIFNSIFSDSSQFAAETHNVNIRMENIIYRLSYFLKNPVFGLGIIRPITPQLISIDRGPMGLFYADDVGIFETMGAFGLFGIIMIIAIWKRWYKSILIILKNRNLDKNIWIIGLFTYYLLSSVSIGYFAADRIICFTIAVAAIEIEIFSRDKITSVDKA